MKLTRKVPTNTETCAITDTFVTVVLLHVLVVMPSKTAVMSVSFRWASDGALFLTTLPTKVSAGAKPSQCTCTPFFSCFTHSKRTKSYTRSIIAVSVVLDTFTLYIKTRTGLSIMPTIVLSITFITVHVVPFRKCTRPPSINEVATKGAFSRTTFKQCLAHGRTAGADFKVRESGARNSNFSIVRVVLTNKVKKKLADVTPLVSLALRVFNPWETQPFELRLKKNFIVRTTDTIENMTFMVVADRAPTPFIKQALVTPQKDAISTSTTAGIVNDATSWGIGAAAKRIQPLPVERRTTGNGTIRSPVVTL